MKNNQNNKTLTGLVNCKKTTRQGKLIMQSRENGQKPQFG